MLDGGIAVKTVSLLKGLSVLLAATPALAQENLLATNSRFELSSITPAISIETRLQEAFSARDVETAAPVVATSDAPRKHGFTFSLAHLKEHPGRITEEPAGASRDVSPSSASLVAPSATRDRAKFCIENLMEGALYDFQKANKMRVEVGPSMCDYRTNDSIPAYEEPFSITFFLRFRM
jgi:hypothetical protein